METDETQTPLLRSRVVTRLPRPTPPRGLIFLASAWLIAGWVMSMGLRPPIQLHAASYTPSVRTLLLSLMVGIGIAWPLVRLSGALRAWPIRQTLLDLLVLLCLAQVVVWPLRLVTPWPPSRSAAIDLLLIGWGLAIAAIVAIGSVPARRGRGLIRSGAMLAIMVILLGVPMATAISGAGLPFTTRPLGEGSEAWWATVALSPLTAVDALSGGGPTPPEGVEWRTVRWSWYAAGALWLAALILIPIIPRLDEDADAPDAGHASPPHGVGPTEVTERAPTG